VTDMYSKMTSGELIYHFAYLVRAMASHAIDLEATRQAEQSHGYHHTPRGKLNADKALKIYKSRLPHVELARRFKVHYSTISNIKHGVTWTKVTGHRKHS